MIPRPALFAAAAALASVALLGCLDAIAPRNPVARGMALAIAPVFDGYGVRDGIPGDVDSIRITLHNPPAADTVVAFHISPGQDSIVITLDVPMTGAFDSVTVTFEAIRSSDGAVLYSGTQTIPVSVTPEPAAAIQARYVGPGQNIRSISISPPAASFKPGDSLAFHFVAVDSTGAVIIGMPALYASGNTGVVTVSQTGLARAVGVGATYVVVTSGARTSVKDSAQVTVATLPPPVIALSSTSVSFVDTAFTADPAPQTLNVTNSGGGTLSDLILGTVTYAAGGSGWLTATLSGAAAPATLTLAAAKGSLTPGTYTATVPVQSASAGNSPQNVSVTFQIVAAPTIVLSATTVTFTDTALTSDPAPQTVNVTAAGGTLSNLTLGTVTYGAGGSGWLTATLSGAAAPATLTLAAAKGSLAPGTYTATVPVQSASAGNSPQNVSVTFQIVAAPTIVLSATTVTFTDTAGTADPAAQTVNVTAAGGTLSNLTLGTVTYGAGGSGWLTASLGGATAPTTLALTVAKGSLTGGTYTATVPVQSASAGNSPQNVSVTFQIVAPARIVLSATTVTFTSTAGTADPAAQTVNVTAAGGTLSNLTLGTVTYGTGGSGWLTATLSGATAPVTLTLAAAKGSLTPGTYTATVPVQSASASNSPQNVSVTFQIVENVPAPPAIGVAGNVSFVDTALTTDPALQTISVTNVGGGTLSGLALGTVTYGPGGSGWLTDSLSGATAPATLTLHVAKGSLAAGTYTATVPVQSGVASNSPQNVTVTFQIVAGPLATITVTPADTELAINGTQQFMAVGKDAAGNVVSVSPSWSVAAGGGTINGTGLFTAGTVAGTFLATVRATSGSIWGAATVHVTAGSLASIIVTPNPATLTTNGTQQFTAVGKDAAGNVVSISPNWSVAAGGGTINGTGLFTAGTVAGTFANTVTATVGSISGTASVTVSIAPQLLASISVTTGFRVMAVGDTATLQVTGKDTLGNSVTPSGVTFISRSPTVASVGGTSGLVTGVAGGRAVIVAQAPGGAGTVTDSSLVAVAASGSAVVSAIGDARAFDVAQVGDPVTVQVLVDLRAVPGDTLGSYNAQLNWNPAALTYVSSGAVTGGFATPVVNEDSVSFGQLRFASANATGSAGAFALIEVRFVGAAAGSSPFTLTLTDLSTAKSFIQLSPAAALVVSGSATIH